MVVLISTSLVSDIEHFFMCSVVFICLYVYTHICMSFLEKYLFRSFAYFSIFFSFFFDSDLYDLFLYFGN